MPKEGIIFGLFSNSVLYCGSRQFRMLDLTDSIFKFQSILHRKSREENPQKPTQLSSRSHPRHLVGKRTAQKTPS